MTPDQDLTAATRTVGNAVAQMVSKLMTASTTAGPSERAAVLVALEATEAKLSKLLDKVNPADEPQETAK